MSCHSVDAKILGPSFKDIAKKYAGDKTADAKLATKIIKGGSGAWGAIPMPANSQVTEADSKTLVKWILSVK
jgi:cytochrome c